MGWQSAARRAGISARPIPAQHFVRSDAQGETKRATAIISVKPVVAGLHGEGLGHADRLWPAPEIWKYIFLLTLEQDFPVVHTPRRVHQAIGFDQFAGG